MLLSSFFNILYIVLAIFTILAISGIERKEKEDKKNRLKAKDMDIRYDDKPDPPTSDTFNTYLAGASFYTDLPDLRGFVGFVYFDPEDEAPRIYRNDMQMLGHVPRERLQEYGRWCTGMRTYPCVGYILPGKDAETLVSEVKIIKPHNKKYVEREISQFINWAVMRYGEKADIRPHLFDPILDHDGLAILKQEKRR